MEAGKLVAQGSLDEMQRRLAPHRRLHVALLGQVDEARAALAGRAGVLAVRVPETAAGANPNAPVVLDVDFSGDDAGVSQLLQQLVGLGLPVLHFSESVHDLEDVFMQATKGIVS